MSYYIPPTGEIRLLYDVPLNANHENTLYFVSEIQQQNYFITKTKPGMIFSDQYYQRVNDGTIRLAIRPELIYDCNYLMFQNFQNTEFQSKWFYAFIDSVEYINNNTCEINYTIDVIQTWYFDYSFKQCFIERQHVNSDKMFEHLVPEPINMGDEYICVAEDEIDLNDMLIGMIATEYIQQYRYTPDRFVEFKASKGEIKNKVYNGLSFTYYDPKDTTPLNLDYLYTNFYTETSYAALQTTIEEFIKNNKEQSIIAMFMFPRVLLVQHPENLPKKNIIHNLAFNAKNNKIHSSPYSFLRISDNSGNFIDYKWECFSYNETDDPNKLTVTFEYCGCLINIPCMLLYPLYYNGIAKNWDAGVKFENFPNCGWSGDAFKAYWAQAGTSILTRGLGIGGGWIMDTEKYNIVHERNLANFETQMKHRKWTPKTHKLTAKYTKGLANIENQAMLAELGTNLGAVGAGVNLGLEIINSINQSIKRPNLAHGDTSSPYLAPQFDRIKYSIYQYILKPEYLEIIDNYFTRFGYQLNTTAIPDVHTRRIFTYVKTVGCDIEAHCPENDAEEICSIFDKGITFWADPNVVGDFSVSNPVIGGE